jgi:hypothetical protein
MPDSTKARGVMTVGALVTVTGYSAVLGSSGLLWFGWAVLGMLTLGMIASRGTD